MVLVVLTRESSRNAQLRAELEGDCDVVELPLTTTRNYEPREVEIELDATTNAGNFGTLAITSARSAPFALAALARCALDAPVAVVGDATARAVIAAGVDAARVRVAPEATGASLGAAIARGPVLALGARETREELADVLAARGLELERVACYETVPAFLDIEERELLASAEVVVIAAPSAWGVARVLVAHEAVIVALGPTTYAAVHADHANVVLAGEDAADVIRTAARGAQRDATGLQ